MFMPSGNKWQQPTVTFFDRCKAIAFSYSVSEVRSVGYGSRDRFTFKKIAKLNSSYKSEQQLVFVTYL